MNAGRINLFKDIINVIIDEHIEFTNEEAIILSYYNTLVSRSMETMLLLDNNMTYSVGVILRSCAEVFLYLKYFFHDEEKTNCRINNAYWWAKYKANETFIKGLRSKVLDKNGNEAKCEKYLKELTSIGYSNEKTFEKYLKTELNKTYTKNMSVYDRRNWYNEDGKINGILDLAKLVDCESEYYSVIMPMNTVVHSGDIIENKKNVPGGYVLENFIDRNTVVYHTNRYVTLITKEVLHYFKAQEYCYELVRKINDTELKLYKS